MELGEIKRMLPYGDDFLQIDEVTELSGSCVMALKTVTEDDCKGHFKDFGIFPGALTLEGMGQAGSLLVRYNIENHEEKDILAYKMNDAVFKKPILPGQQIVYNVKLVSLDSERASLECSACVNGREVASVTMVLAIVDKESFRQKYS